MKFLFLGSISVLADTSELQRDAFNQAFAEAGLDWHWTQDAYRDMLTSSGGADRIAEFARQTGDTADATALHARKTEIFQQSLRAGKATLRPEIEQLITRAQSDGTAIAMVSGTSRASLEALLDSLGGAQALGIQLITSKETGVAPKPDPALYAYALDQLSLDPSEVIAVEDNAPGVQAARAAGITVLAYPNANTAGHDFGTAQDLRSWLTDKAA